MRRLLVLAALLGITALDLTASGPARADNFSIGVQTSNLNLGINIGSTPPPLVAVPGPVVTGPPPPPVYTAPGLPYNYFVYERFHYLYHEGQWFRSRRHNGPWTVIAIATVPRPILALPIERYRIRPTHWQRHGPPPWKHEQDREWRHERGRGRGHDREDERHGRGHDKRRD